MACTGDTKTMSELDFVLSLHTRHKNIPGHCGPLLTIELSPWRVFTLEHIFDSDAATELLWDGHESGEKYGTAFTLCGGHWLDLAALAGFAIVFAAIGMRLFKWSNEG